MSIFLSNFEIYYLWSDGFFSFYFSAFAFALHLLHFEFINTFLFQLHFSRLFQITLAQSGADVMVL